VVLLIIASVVAVIELLFWSSLGYSTRGGPLTLIVIGAAWIAVIVSAIRRAKRRPLLRR
jgi:hypothetical protein